MSGRLYRILYSTAPYCTFVFHSTSLVIIPLVLDTGPNSKVEVEVERRNTDDDVKKWEEVSAGYCAV